MTNNKGNAMSFLDGLRLCFSPKKESKTMTVSVKHFMKLYTKGPELRLKRPSNSFTMPERSEEEWKQIDAALKKVRK